MLRYLKSLENKDISMVHSMISLGSCTMKLNASAEMMPITWKQSAHLHPFAPLDQIQGTLKLIHTLEKDLAHITGFANVSLQPNSGAQGELTGLLVIKAYHESNNESHRNIALIPSSAHGTNPASAAMTSLKVVVVKCDDHGNIDIDDLDQKITEHGTHLSCLMVTYPSTHGVFELGIKDICEKIHQVGGQVYMDGANLNAQLGHTSPGAIGADVCHLNLHKTFAIPHGGGGPGVGPIGVAKHLSPFLPGHPIIKTGGQHAIGPVSAAPYGSVGVLPISYGYIKMMGGEGLTEATNFAILNANYIKDSLKDFYPVLYTGHKDRCAHEFILDCRGFKDATGIQVEDIAKRLMDFGFHAPTVSFPVVGTLMIEPTESEPKVELDRFAAAMIQIRKEIQKIEDGLWPQDDNPIMNAPHTSAVLLQEHWEHSYTRTEAAFPLDWVQKNKYWPTVARVDNAYGDRNLFCSCIPTDEL
jgi:glycine dehydrogenase